MADTIQLLATGDICLCEPVRQSMDRFGAGFPFELWGEIFEAADVRFGNLECMIVPDRMPVERAPEHKMLCTASMAEGLWQAGFDVLNLAANHILDCGPQAALATLDACADHGVHPLGFAETSAAAREPVIVPAGGLSLAFLGVVEDCPGLGRQTSPGPAYLVPEHLMADVAAAKEDADLVVVSMHAGLEFNELPAPWRMDLCRRLIEQGADVVLCHHPHVPQGIEVHQGGLICYSLGNFVFPRTGERYMEYGGVWTGRSYALAVDLSADGYEGHELIPYEISHLHRPEPLEPDSPDGQAILEHVARISGLLADEQAVAASWDALCRKYFEAYLDSAAKAAAAGDRDALYHNVARLMYDENQRWVQPMLDVLSECVPPHPSRAQQR
jgi:hypothetical protein